MAIGNLDNNYRSDIKKTYYDVPQDKLTLVFAAKHTLSHETKMITAIHHLFPGSHDSISNFYEKGTEESLPTCTHKIPGISERNQFIIATVTAVFSEYRCSMNYLHTRATNVCSTLGVTVPLLTEFVEYIKAITWFDASSDINFKQQMGWIVAVNKQGIVDREVHESQLMTIEEYRTTFTDSSKWALALLREARSVYLNYKMNLLWVGISVIPLIKTKYNPDNFRFTADVNRFENIIPSISGKPYIGLVSELPRHLHMYSHAKIVYIGMVYKNRVNPRAIMCTRQVWQFIKSECRLGNYFKRHCEKIARSLPLHNQ